MRKRTLPSALGAAVVSVGAAVVPGAAVASGAASVVVVSAVSEAQAVATSANAKRIKVVFRRSPMIVLLDSLFIE
jgi:hypothetical protein